MVAELPAGGVIVSYDLWKFTPYISGRVSLTKYENYQYGWNIYTNREGKTIRSYSETKDKNKIAFLPAVGCEIRIIENIGLVVEGGIIPDYYRKDDLYVIGVGVIF